MARAPSAFRAGDVTKAVKAVVAAGVDIARVEIDSTGRITIIGATAPAANQGDLSGTLAYLDWAMLGGVQPQSIGEQYLGPRCTAAARLFLASQPGGTPADRAN
jgi:hypothetical protein